MTDTFCEVYDFTAIKSAVEDGQKEDKEDIEVFDILDILLEGLDMEDRLYYLRYTLARNLGSNDNE
tara:strand:+ start:1025 stop:1222 length:198 start_codon:yes stop_codon:yes gene_type:complete